MMLGRQGDVHPVYARYEGEGQQDDRYFVDRLAHLLLENLVFDLLYIGVYLAEDREARVYQLVYHQVEQIAGGSVHRSGPRRRILSALLEEARQRLEIARMDRNQI